MAMMHTWLSHKPLCLHPSYSGLPCLLRGLQGPPWQTAPALSIVSCLCNSAGPSPRALAETLATQAQPNQGLT